ncbi:hypothetical protein ACFQDD_08065 [Halorubrum pallidum]|uniref:Uncharacterized protein n=1 Tax=Halorubrum pallidum TaxID=1526114 RepID=A0ABD5T2H1_9EURY
MSRRRPESSVYARRTAETSDEYFRPRVLNLDSVEYLRAVAKAVAEYETDREKQQERIKLVNRRLTEVKADSDGDSGADGGATGQPKRSGA